MRVFKELILVAFVGGAGWIGGASLGAPEPFVNTVTKSQSALFEKIRDIMTPAQEPEPEANADEKPVATVATAATFSSPAPSVKPGRKPDTAPAITIAAHMSHSGNAVPLCKMEISNAPERRAKGDIATYTDEIDVNGVSMLLVPATNVCLSSGFGHRGFQPHRGVDYYTKAGGDVLAAGDGVVLERVRRDDYGNMVLIDHGNGVYTRYAHLESFADGLVEGKAVIKGEVLGPIGATGRAGAVHLHFEIREGDYDNPKASWGLSAIDPYQYHSR